jgi:anaerobic selenocysteine-containing dehydrogenase
MPKHSVGHIAKGKKRRFCSRQPSKRDGMPEPFRSLAKSACPHDCPSACSLEVPVLGNGRIGRITGARDNSYTLGVVCAKVARYAERVEHPNRLLNPLRRKGPKGEGVFEPIGWDDGLTARRRSSRRIWRWCCGLAPTPRWRSPS